MLKPSPGRLLVTEPPVPDDGGIILPPGVQGMELESYIVVEVGADSVCPVTPGDRVYVFAAHFAKINDVKVIDSGAIVAYEGAG